MFGFHIEELQVVSVFPSQPQTFVTVWSKKGIRSITVTDNNWHLAKVPVILLNGAQVSMKWA
jgi:hypothetical protein